VRDVTECGRRVSLAHAVLCSRCEFRALTVNTRHLLKEIVMRNFIYAITLVGLGMLQLAIVVVEIARV